MRDLTIIHHKGNCDNSPYPGNSLEAVRDSLNSGASMVEVDIHPLLNEDYLVTHDADLEKTTTDYGKVEELTFKDAQKLKIKAGDTITQYHIPLLRDLVTLIKEHNPPTRLQLDFKRVYPFQTDEPLTRLLSIIQPIQSHVIVTSMGDWHLRQLKRLAPDLEVGFDPMMYFDLRDPEWSYPPELPPYRQGAYGYHDDSLLSISKIWSPYDYVRDRCDTLAHQVPGASTLFMSYRTLEKALDDGVNFAQSLREYDMQVAVWTVDVDNDIAVATAKKLYDAGFDLFISNTPLTLFQALK